MIYGVSQFCYGHEHKWIFTEEEIKRQTGRTIEDHDWLDIHFPIGGSNSSATSFEKLDNDEDVRGFLTAKAEGPDLEDPELVDIAEYYLTVDTDYGSCTQEYLDRLGLKKEELMQEDDVHEHYANAERMINELKDMGYAGFSEINPFYGEHKDMRYSDLEALYQAYKEKLGIYDKGNDTMSLFIDISDIPDSILLASNQVIASYTDKEKDVSLSLEVRGEVHICYKDRDYYDASEFPKELVDIIRNGYYDEAGEHHSYLDSPDIYVSENNWFEMFEMNANDNYLGRTWVVDAENYTDADIKSLFEETAEEILKEREADKDKTDDEREV